MMLRSSAVRHPTCSSRWIARSVLALRTSGYSPPWSNWRNWTTNSTARMASSPVLTSHVAVAEAAMAALDLEVGPPGRDRPLLDPPLQGLDLGNLAGSEIAAIDERGD